MADGEGERQARAGEFVPVIGPVPTLLSEDQHRYVDGVAAQQAKAAADETLNGAAATRKLRGDG